MRRTLLITFSIVFITLWVILRPPMQLRAPESIQHDNPITILDITLQHYQFDGFTSVVPLGWRQEPEGAFAFADTDYAIVQRAITAPSLGWVQPSMRDELNLTSVTFVEEYSINGLDWQLYQGSSPDFAITYTLANGQGWTVYMVLMQVPEEDFGELRNALFLSTLAAFEPT